MGYFLQKAERYYVIIEKESVVGIKLIRFRDSLYQRNVSMKAPSSCATRGTES